MTAAPRWSAERYGRHAGPRLRPALDLLGRVELHDARTVVDLGCGAGALFPALRARFPEAAITGVDTSPAMLAKARKLDPDVSLIEADVASWRPERPVDLIVANALLHWLPDHERLLPDLLHSCRVLAVQVPSNFDAPSHRLIRELMAEPPWSARLGSVRLGDSLLPAPPCHAILTAATASADLWETTYFHALSGPTRCSTGSRTPRCCRSRPLWAGPGQRKRPPSSGFWPNGCGRPTRPTPAASPSSRSSICS